MLGAVPGWDEGAPSPDQLIEADLVEVGAGDGLPSEAHPIG